MVVLPPEYRWLLGLDDNPQAYGEVWEEFNDSVIVIEYVDTASGETLEDRLVELLTPDLDNGGFHMVVNDDLIQQLTPLQVFRLWEAVSDEDVVLPPDVDRAALTEKLWTAMSKLEQMATVAMAEYRAGLTVPLDPDTL